jgi:hypothetical protein
MIGQGYASDDALLGSLAPSDPSAIAVLAGRYARAVYDFDLRATLDSAAASEITASVFQDLKREPGSPIGARARILVAAWQAVIDRESPAAAASSSKLATDDPSFVETRGPSYREPVRWAWEAARTLPLREYTMLDLVLRRGLTPQDLRAVGGPGLRGIHSSLIRARDAFEEAYVTLILANRGDCRDLREFFTVDATVTSLTVRRRVANHSKQCPACQERLASFPDAVHAFLALPDLRLPDELPGRILGLVEQTAQKPAREVAPEADESEEAPRPRALIERIVALPEPGQTQEEPALLATGEEETRRAEPEQRAAVAEEQARVPEALEQGLGLEPEVEAKPEVVRQAAEPEAETQALPEAVEEIAAAEEEPYSTAEACEEAWDEDEGYEYLEDEKYPQEEVWLPELEPTGAASQRRPVSTLAGEALAGFRVLEAGLSSRVNTTASNLAGGQFLRNYALFGVATAVAIYLGLVFIATRGPGGEGAPEFPLGRDGSSNTVACEPIEMTQGSAKALTFDVVKLDGYTVQTVTVDPTSRGATPGGVTATREGPEGISLRSTSSSRTPPSVDQYRMQVRLTRGQEVALSTCTVKVRAGP